MTSALIVAGFHRSGTSMVAQILQQAGIFLGREMIGANSSNPHGHIEDREFVALHRRVMEAHGDTWQVDGPRIYHLAQPHWEAFDHLLARRRASHQLWGFKDPRVCFFMGVWEYLVPEANFLVVHRDPTECVDSLRRRHAADIFNRRGPQALHKRFWDVPDLGYRMWLWHNEHLLDFAKGHPDRVMVVSADQMRQGFPLVERLRQRWALPLKATPTLSVYDRSSMQSASQPVPIQDPTLNKDIERMQMQLSTMSEDFHV